MTTVATSREAPAAEPTTSAPAVVLLRATGAVLLVYGYLVGMNSDLAPVRDFLNRPLGLGEDFGPLGAMLLLATAGYESVTRQPSVRRVVLTYLPLAVTVLLAAGMVALGATIWTIPAADHTSPLTVVGNLTLLSQLIAVKPLLVPLGWIVLLELLAWATGALVRRLSGHTRLAVPAVHLAVAAAAILLVDHDHRAVTVAAFSGVVVIGQVVALGGRFQFVLAPAAWLLFVLAEHQYPVELSRWWYPVAAVYAGLLFASAVVFAGPTAAKVAENRVVVWLADNAIWLALLQGVFGFAITHASTVVAGVLATLGATAALGWMGRSR
ncbi:hypothetical protein ACRAKI_00315 [Saccharothrix isguenensis]